MTKSLYDQMKENIEKNRDMVIRPVEITNFKCKKLRELEDRMDWLCYKIKKKNGWL